MVKYKLSASDIEALKFAVGAIQMPAPIHWGYRNSYQAAQGDETAGRLVRMGMLRPERPGFLSVTRTGCQAIGVLEQRIPLALEMAKVPQE